MGIFNLFKKENKSNTNPEKQTTITVNMPTVNHGEDEIIPIEKRIQGTTPICDGLYEHEVLVLSYAHRYYTVGNNFQGFWLYQYGVSDVQSILNSLTDRSYLQLGSIRDAISKETAANIKTVLSNHSLKTTGKKDVLIQTLVDNLSESELNSLFPKRPYAVTPKGEDVLKHYEWIPYIHSHRIEGLDIWNLTQMVLSSNSRRYRDVIWSYLNKTAMDHAQALNFGLYRNTKLTMSDFVAEENRYDVAFDTLCEVCIYDISGLTNSFNIKYLANQAQFYFPYEESIAKIAPGIVAKMNKYIELLSWDSNTVHQRIEANVNKIDPGFHLFTIDERIKIIEAELAGNEESIPSIYSAAEKRFRKKFK